MAINERQKPYQTTQAEQALRWRYGQGEITREEFDEQYVELMKQGLIVRSGKVITNDE